MFRTALASISGMILLTACTPHPGAGLWLSPAANADDITRLSVFLDATAETWTSLSSEPATHCEWKPIDKQAIEINCVYLVNSSYTVTYRLSVTDKDRADLYKSDRLLTKLFRHRKAD